MSMKSKIVSIELKLAISITSVLLDGIIPPRPLIKFPLCRFHVPRSTLIVALEKVRSSIGIEALNCSNNCYRNSPSHSSALNHQEDHFL